MRNRLLPSILSAFLLIVSQAAAQTFSGLVVGVTDECGKGLWRPGPSRWRTTTELCSATADAELQAVLSQKEKGSLRPEMGKAAFPLGFRKEELPRMALSAKRDEISTRKTD